MAEKRHVCFSEQTETFSLENENEWFDDYKRARESDWRVVQADAMRFKRRIQETETMLTVILKRKMNDCSAQPQSQITTEMESLEIVFESLTIAPNLTSADVIGGLAPFLAENISCDLDVIEGLIKIWLREKGMAVAAKPKIVVIKKR